jgi:hypothetical protein
MLAGGTGDAIGQAHFVVVFGGGWHKNWLGRSFNYADVAESGADVTPCVLRLCRLPLCWVCDRLVAVFFQHPGHCHRVVVMPPMLKPLTAHRVFHTGGGACAVTCDDQARCVKPTETNL